MPGNFKKEDLRVIKTYKSLVNAMSKLLGVRNFAQITVNDLCEEAQISRTTFYLHFNDKYDLIKHWLANIKSNIINERDTYENIEKSVNEFVNDNSKIIKNLIENANSETSELLCDFMLSLLDINVDKADSGQMSQKHIVLSRFCSGGMMNYLQWQVSHKFPADLQMMNTYLYDILITLLQWNEDP